MENTQYAKDMPARLRAKTKKPRNFSSFDRSFFMWLRTEDGTTIWNRSRSMLNNGHRPSEVALNLYQHFGVKLGMPCGDSDPERDQAAIDYFAGLVLPDDAPGAPSIFDEAGGEA